MNKNLIQKLLIQSCWDEQDEIELEDLINVEQFAELIVRECVDWCDAYATVDGTAQKIAGSIKEHFGVE